MQEPRASIENNLITDDAGERGPEAASDNAEAVGRRGGASKNVPPHWSSSIKAFWIAVAFMAVLLFSLIPVVNNNYIALPDEGVYSAQASALSHGSWWEPRPAPDVDTAGYFDPVGSSAVKDELRLPYARHPLYSLTLSLFYRLGGQFGMLALSVIGGLGAAISAGLIARRLNPAYGIPTLLIAGIGSPLLFNSYVVVAHNLATALAGFLLLSVLSLMDGGRRWLLLATAATAVLVPNFRSEGAIFIGGLALALALVSLPIPKLRRTQWTSLICGLTVGVFGLGGYLADIAASRAVSSFNGYYTAPLQAIGGAQSDPMNAARIAVLQPWSYGGDATIPALVILASVAVGAVAMRLLPRRHLLPLALVSIAAVCAIWWNFTDLTLVTGLLPTLPLLVFAAIWLTRTDLSRPIVLVLILSAIISLVGLLVTIHGDGGAAQWGGRLVQIVLPALIPLAVLGLHNASSVLPNRSSRFALGCLLVLSVSVSVYSLRANHESRDESKRLVTGFDGLVADHRSGKSLTLLTRGVSDGRPRAFWAKDTDLNLISAPFRFSFRLMQDAERAGYNTVIMVTDAPDEAMTEADSKWKDRLSLRRGPAVGTVSGLRVFVYSDPKG